MELKPPLTFAEQIKRLEKHGMLIESEEDALRFLQRVNYYRFTGYALENRKDTHSSDYQQGTSFAQIQKRYQFDVEIRHILRKAIEDVEVYYRTQISYVFSMRKCLESPHDQHYDRRNYYRKEDFDKLMKRILKEEEYYYDSLVVTHHKEKYANRMPLWVLVELMTFSTLSKFYACMYYSDQIAIAEEIGTSAPILKNHLHCLSILRNKCAHAGRLYGEKFNPPARFSRNFLQKHPEIKGNKLFGYIVMLIQRLPGCEQKQELIEGIVSATDRYATGINLRQIGFPENYATVLRHLMR